MSCLKSSVPLALAAALALAACAAEGGKPVATAAQPEPAQEVAAAAPEPAVAETAPEAEPAPEPELMPLAEETIEAAIAALTTPEPDIEDDIDDDIDDDPGQVIDLEGAALEALLGAPGFRREELNAQVWQYLGEGCVLDVYLYSDGLAAPYRVAHYEVRAGDGGADDARGRRCFRGLLLSRAAG